MEQREGAWEHWGEEGNVVALLGGQLTYRYKGITFIITADLDADFFYCDEDSINDGPDMEIHGFLSKHDTVREWFTTIRAHAENWLIENAER